MERSRKVRFNQVLKHTHIYYWFQQKIVFYKCSRRQANYLKQRDNLKSDNSKKIYTGSKILIKKFSNLNLKPDIVLVDCKWEIQITSHKKLLKKNVQKLRLGGSKEMQMSLSLDYRRHKPSCTYSCVELKLRCQRLKNMTNVVKCRCRPVDID